jgi:hypothetical protein
MLVKTLREIEAKIRLLPPNIPKGLNELEKLIDILPNGPMIGLEGSNSWDECKKTLIRYVRVARKYYAENDDLGLRIYILKLDRGMEDALHDEYIYKASEYIDKTKKQYGKNNATRWEEARPRLEEKRNNWCEEYHKLKNKNPKLSKREAARKIKTRLNLSESTETIRKHLK